MENVFDNLVIMISRVNPILVFVLLLVAIGMLLYIKKHLDGFFYSIKMTAIQLKKLNENLKRISENNE